jgi:transcriptional regulator with XRE-family HTH domain
MREHALRVYRKKNGIRLQQLASQVGVGASSLSKIERGIGAPSMALLGRLIKATNGAVSPFDFLEKEPPHETRSD